MTAPSRPHFTVQVGLGWHLERPGGLERVFQELTARLPANGFDVQGLVVGDARVATESEGRVRAFAPEDAALWRRILGVRNRGNDAGKEKYEKDD